MRITKKLNKKFLIAIACVCVLCGFAIPAFASSTPTSPAEILADLTDQSVDELLDERLDGRTYGAIAQDYGVLDEFKSEVLEMKEQRLQQAVEAETLTQDEADAILANIAQAQENCDPDSTTGYCPNQGCGYGFGNGNGCGRGHGCRGGRGMGCCLYN